MQQTHRILGGLAATLLAAGAARADVGDPQVRTDHPWYPGELAMSTFERLFATQAALYRRVTGRDATTDEDKALAAWLWRNTHYWHGTEGQEDLWGKGWNAPGDNRTRDYWKGLFADGFGLCGTTHSQWTAEFEHLLGHNRGRGLGVNGHNSFEVWLTGGAYGDGRWALLDHDISTAVFSEDGTRLLSMPEVKANLQKLADPAYKTDKQRGWLVAGLHPKDAYGVFERYGVAEYLAGYVGAPPMVRLRRGETFRRHLRPGLDDGKTFVHWGQNMKAGGIPGPARPQTWVNQPEKMFKAKEATPYREGQARYANAVYTYAPDFSTSDYKEGVIDEADDHVTFEFYTPYIIGCTPPNDKEWGIYDAGGKNGLVLSRAVPCAVSVDQGKTWKEAAGVDLTDLVKGHRQYFLRFNGAAKTLAGLSWRTVCQASVSTIPRLKDGGTRVTFEASGTGIVSVGPTMPQAQAHVVEGAFGSRNVTLEIAAPRKEPGVRLVAAGHVASSAPPSPEVKYQIEWSSDGGKSWTPVVKDWQVVRRGAEPKDFWSQSLVYGEVALPDVAAPLRVRFRNDGGKSWLRAEAHLVYKTPATSTQVAFDWTDDAGPHKETKVFGASGAWDVATGKNVQTRWVEFATVK